MGSRSSARVVFDPNSLVQDISAIGSDIDLLADAVTELATDVSDLATAVSGIDGKVSGLESDISGLNTNISHQIAQIHDNLENDLLNIIVKRGKLITTVFEEPTGNFFAIDSSTQSDKTFTYTNTDGDTVIEPYIEYNNVEPSGYIGDLMKAIVTFIFGEWNSKYLTVLISKTVFNNQFANRFTFLQKNLIDLNFSYVTSTYGRAVDLQTTNKAEGYGIGPFYYQTLAGFSAEPQASYDEANYTGKSLIEQFTQYAKDLLALPVPKTDLVFSSSPNCTAAVVVQNIINNYKDDIESGASGITVSFNTNGETTPDNIYVEDDWVHSAFFQSRTLRFDGTRPTELSLNDNYNIQFSYTKNANTLNTLIKLVLSTLYNLDKNDIATLVKYEAALTKNLIQAKTIRDIRDKFASAFGLPGSIQDYGLTVLNGSGALSSIIAKYTAIDFTGLPDLYKYNSSSAQPK